MNITRNRVSLYVSILSLSIILLSCHFNKNLKNDLSKLNIELNDEIYDSKQNRKKYNNFIKIILT